MFFFHIWTQQATLIFLSFHKLANLFFTFDEK